MTANGAFHWNELMTRDVAKAKDFYKKTLGWTYEDTPMGEMYGTYTVVKAGDQMVAGMFKMDGPMFEGQPESWFSYVAVDDLDKRLKKVKEFGWEGDPRALGSAECRPHRHRPDARRGCPGMDGAGSRRNVGTRRDRRLTPAGPSGSTHSALAVSDAGRVSRF